MGAAEAVEVEPEPPAPEPAAAAAAQPPEVPASLREAWLAAGPAVRQQLTEQELMLRTSILSEAMETARGIKRKQLLTALLGGLEALKEEELEKLMSALFEIE